MYNQAERTLTTERLILRPFKESDAQRVSELCNNYNIYKSTLTLPYPYSNDCALSWIQTQEANFNSNKSYEFAITDKNTYELYGAIGLSNNQSHKNGELGYWIGEEYWGKDMRQKQQKLSLSLPSQKSTTIKCTRDTLLQIQALDGLCRNRAW